MVLPVWRAPVSTTTGERDSAARKDGIRHRLLTAQHSFDLVTEIQNGVAIMRERDAPSWVRAISWRVENVPVSRPL